MLHSKADFFVKFFYRNLCIKISIVAVIELAPNFFGERVVGVKSLTTSFIIL